MAEPAADKDIQGTDQHVVITVNGQTQQTKPATRQGNGLLWNQRMQPIDIFNDDVKHPLQLQLWSVLENGQVSFICDAEIDISTLFNSEKDSFI